MNRIEKINFGVTSIVRMLLIVAIGFAIIDGNYIVIFISLLTFILSFLPELIEKTVRVTIPAELGIVTVLFIYAALFLGEIYQYYIRFWWWDSFLHFFAGIVLGFAGFLILYVLHKSGRLKTNAGLIILFSFCFALALGAIWEIIEFGIDMSTYSDMQKTAKYLYLTGGSCNMRLGVIDTIVDLILDSLGAIIASVLGYIYLKNGEPPLFARLVRSFEEKNPKLFEN